MGMTAHENLIIDGKNCADYGVWISGSGTFDASPRAMESIVVPGRNGDLHFDNGRFQNIAVTYPAFISRRFQPRMDDFRAWLCSKYRYVKIEDTYHPDEFRLGLFKGGLTVSTTARNLSGSFNLTFDCKPQRFLKSGEIPVTYTASGTIYNPTEYAAKPLIKCYGTGGTVTINGVSVGVTGCTNYVILDCDLMESYEGSTSRNGTTTLVNGEFPTLGAGANAVAFSGFSRVEITPRWWRI